MKTGSELVGKSFVDETKTGKKYYKVIYGPWTDGYTECLSFGERPVTKETWGRFHTLDNTIEIKIIWVDELNNMKPISEEEFIKAAEMYLDRILDMRWK